MAEPVAETVDARAAQAYALLQEGRAAEALPELDALVEPAAERPALLARVHAWACQAHLRLADPKAARKRLSAALRVAREGADADALKALLPLQQQVMAAMTARAAPQMGTQTPAGQAVAALDRGERAEGERLALEARRLAQEQGDAREEVLALLALARLDEHTDDAIAQAADVADQSGDFNLVTAVSRAAAAAGQPLAPKVF